MDSLFALMTSDPNLLRCELHRLAESVALGAAGVNAMGAGWFVQDAVLLRRFPFDSPPPPIDELGHSVESEAFVYQASHLPVGLSLEDNTQPFRFRHWLFAHAGELNEFARLRPRLLAALPDLLQRQIRGDTDSEAAFAVFLKHLKETGRFEDLGLDAALAAQLLGRTVRTLEQFAAEAGAARASTLNFVATNGRMLIATRFGTEPLYYALLEGTATCELCKLDVTAAEAQPAVRAHRRRRTVAFASQIVGKGNGWIELPSGMAIAVDRALNVQRLPI